MKTTELRLQLYGSPILSRKTKPVGEITYEIKECARKMHALMKEHNGIGLAANQAGLDLQIVVIDTGEQTFTLFNPLITQKSGTATYEEGCLSFPGIALSIQRAKEVWVDYCNDQGSQVQLHAQGILAIALQHEIDHLNGIVFIERIPFLKRMSLKKQLTVIKKIGKTEKGEQWH